MDITSANAKCFLTIEELFPAGVLLQNYATDQAVDQDERQISIVRMGVDGHMAAGWTPQPHIIHFTFEANSPSLTYIRALAKYMETQKKNRSARFSNKHSEHFNFVHVLEWRIN